MHGTTIKKRLLFI